jgi:glycosyltransferase involved in cell wall biosynthesis
LIVTTSWPRTGDELAGTFVRTDALAHARLGHVVVATPRGPGVARGGGGLELVDVEHGGAFGSPGAATRILERPWRALGLATWARDVRRVIDVHAPTRIVAHWLTPAGGLACALAPQGARVELVAHGGDVRLLEALPRAIARRYIDTLCDRATLVRVVSAALLQRLAAIAPGVSAKALVAPMPLATDDDALVARVRTRSEALRRTYGAHRMPLAQDARGQLLHVVVSRLVRDKPIERAIDHVARRRGRLVLVGDGPERTHLLAYAARVHVDVEATGALPHEEALAWIAAADVLLAPLARGEGAPTAIREARALGVPVIALA